MQSFGVQHQEGTNSTKQIQSNFITFLSALHGDKQHKKKGNEL